MSKFIIGRQYLIEGAVYTLIGINPIGHYFEPKGESAYSGWYLEEGDGLELVQEIDPIPLENV